jgi:hypothetical protein
VGFQQRLEPSGQRYDAFLWRLTVRPVLAADAQRLLLHRRCWGGSEWLKSGSQPRQLCLRDPGLNLFAGICKNPQDGPVALALEGVGRGRLEQRPGLAVAQRRRLALITLGFGALDAADRVMAHRVDLAEVVEERGDRGQLAPDGALGQAPAFEVFLA